MGLYRLRIKGEFGEFEVEGETPEEILEGLRRLPEVLKILENSKELPELLRKTDEILSKRERGLEKKVSLKGIVETTSEGPVLTVPRDQISDKEALGVLLYSLTSSRSSELYRLLNLSGKLSPGAPSRLSEMKREGLVVKDGDHYKLTMAGIRMVEEKTLPRLKSTGRK